MQIEKINAYILKRQGKLSDALMAYAHRYVAAQEEDNEYIQQVCLDQMLDIQLLHLLKEGERFSSRAELKREVQYHLTEVLREVGVSEGISRKQFDNSWSKFSRRGPKGRAFSVNWEKLSRPKSEEIA